MAIQQNLAAAGLVNPLYVHWHLTGGQNLSGVIKVELTCPLLAHDDVVIAVLLESDQVGFSGDPSVHHDRSTGRIAGSGKFEHQS